jgi:membrane-anchored glycerophosphoryl diester phosphodiesterase (GDPDase)
MKHPDRSISFSIVRFMAVLNRFFVFNQKNWVIGLLGAAGLVFSMWMLPVLFLDGPVERIGFRMIEGTAMFFYVQEGLYLPAGYFLNFIRQIPPFSFLHYRHQHSKSSLQPG